MSWLKARRETMGARTSANGGAQCGGTSMRRIGLPKLPHHITTRGAIASTLPPSLSLPRSLLPSHQHHRPPLLPPRRRQPPSSLSSTSRRAGSPPTPVSKRLSDLLEPPPAPTPGAVVAPHRVSRHTETLLTRRRRRDRLLTSCSHSDPNPPSQSRLPRQPSLC